ncbi:hypothetical protein EBQ74_00035, partial [bacterium]|nr:hypothetical protein [bacterium]
MTSSFCALRMVHPNALQVVAHYPWLLIALDHFLDSKEVSARLRGVFEWALLMGSMILIGYPQYVLISVFLQLIYIFVCFPISKILSSWKLFCVGAISGLAIGAAQLLPTWEYFTDSERTLLGIDFVGWGSLNPLQFFQWFGPYVYKGLSLFSEGFASGTHEYGLYEGVFAVFAILWSLFEKQRNLGQAQWFRLAVILMVVGLFLSLGKYNGVFYLYGPLKPFSFFRYHSRTRVLLSLGVSLLSALAFDDLVSSKKRWVPKKVYLLPGIMSVLIALVAIAIKVFRPDLSHQFFSNGILLVTPLAFLILGSIFYMGGTDKKWFPIFLVLFVV